MDINHAKVPVRDIAFVFNNVQNYGQLAATFRPGVEVHVLDASQDGLAQIAAIVEGRSGIGAMHVVGHGSDGALNLGSLTLNAANLGSYQDVLGRIGGALAEDGDILLYGCDVAADALGARFVGQLAQATGADIAASLDATGSAARGGNWTLEFSEGQVASGTALDTAAVRSLDTLLALPPNGVINIADANNGTAGTIIQVDGGVFKMTATKELTADPDPVDGVYLIAGTTDEKITIEADGTQFSSFDLTGMDWVKFFDGVAYDGSYTFNITGYKLGGGTVTTSFTTVDGSPTYSAANYVQFTNITKFDIQILTTSAGDKPSANTFDNFSIANADNVPMFVDPSAVTLNISQNGSASNLKTLLNVNDSDSGQTLTWTQGTGPAHGTLSISGATAASGTNVTPGGTVNYTPTAGFAGEDTFTINVNDGIRTATKTFTMFVKAAAPSTPDLTSATDTGTSNSDNQTNASTLSFSGTGVAGDSTTKVRVFIDQNGNGAYDVGEINGITTMSNGSWTVSGLSAAALADNTYSVVAQSEVSTSGGTLTNASTALQVKIDRTAPSVTISSDKSTLKAGETALVTLTFTEDPGSSLTVGDLVASGGTVSALSATGATRTVTFTPTANTNSGTASVSLAGSAYTDAAGNNGSSASTPSITFDTLKPSLTISTDLSTLKIGQTAHITFTFTEDPGTSFTDSDIAFTGGSLGPISGTGLTRTATFTPTSNTNGGVGSITVAGGDYTDLAGNPGTPGTTPTLNFDTLAPAAPSTPALASGSDTGLSNSDLLTNRTAPTLTGTAEAGATITLYDTGGVTQIGSGIANGSGVWTITTSTLAAGGHTVTAKATDAAGNASGASTSLGVTIDTTAPTVAITSDAASLKGGETATITFTFSEDPGTSFTNSDVAASGGTLGALSGSGLTRTAVFTPAVQSSGTASITIASGTWTDAAGNNGGAGATPLLTYDTTQPTLTITSSASTLKSGETANITFTFSLDPGASFTAADVVVTGGSIGAITGTGLTRTAVFTPAVDTNAGTASITVAAGTYSAGGNTGLAGTSPSLTFDTLVPAAPSVPVFAPGSDTGVSGTDGITADTTPTLTGTAEAGATVNLYHGATLIGTGIATGGNWSITTSALSAGAHSITAVATDAAGNVGNPSAALAVTIDTSAPTLLITSDRAALKAGETAAITFTFDEEPGATFTAGDIIITGGTLGALSGGPLAYTATFTPDAGNGTASITVDSGKYTDAAGNNGTAGASLSLPFDTVRPTLTISADDTTLKIGETATITFTFTEDPGVSFNAGDIAVTGGSLSALSTTGLVRTAVFTPAAGVDNGTASITVAGVTYTDAAGNNAAADSTLSLAYDTLVPTAPSAPDLQPADDLGFLDTDDITADTTPSFTGTAEVGATVKLYDGATLIGTGTAAGGNWSITSSALGNGSHSITAVAIDAAGNTSSASAPLAVTIETVAPTLAILTDKSQLKAGEMATITFTFSEDPGNTFAWDGGSGDIAVTGGTLGAISGSGLTRTAVFTPTAGINGGAANITVAAGSWTDAAGNDGGAGAPPSLNFDTLEPTLAITSSTDKLKAGETATITFTFSEDPGATFAWDGASGDVVVSGGTLGSITGTGLTRSAVFTPTTNTNGGMASITVASGTYTDAAGNGGQAGVTPSLTFDTMAPAVPSVQGVVASSDTGQSDSDDLTRDVTPTLAGTAEANAIVKLYDTDGITVIGSGTTDAGGNWTIQTGVLGHGVHNITSVAIDAAGNTSSASAPLEVTIDTVAPTLGISSDKSQLKAGESAIITFTFTEDPGNTFAWDGSSGDIAVTGGTLGAISGSGLTRTAVFTPTGGINGGAASITVAAGSWTDTAGNDGGAGAPPSLTFDTLAPTLAITSSTDKLKAGETAIITLTFSEDPGVSFVFGDIVVAGGSLGALSGTGTTRTAVFTPTDGVDSGTASITVASGLYSDAAGNGGGEGVTPSLVFDTLVPAAPDSLALAAGDDTGTSDNLTNKSTPAITGNAADGMTISLYDGATMIGTTTATGGSWSITTPMLGEGGHNLTAIATDLAGNESAQSGALTVTIDRTAPNALSLALVADTGSSASDGVTSNGHVQVSGIEAGATWEYSLNGGTSWLAGSGSEFQLPADGMYSLLARQHDLAGNTSSDAALAVQLDATAPTATVTLDRSVLTIGQSALVTIDFGEVVTGFDASHISVTNGTLSGFASANGDRTWTATLTPDNVSTGNVVSVSNVGLVDEAGNDGLGSGTATYTVRPNDPPPGGGGTGITILPFIDPVTGLPSQVVNIPAVPSPGWVHVPLGSNDSGTGDSLTANVPGGVGLQVSGPNDPLTHAQALVDLIARIENTVTPDSDEQNMTGQGTSFLDSLGTGVEIETRTIVPTMTPGAAPGAPIIISGTPGEPGSGAPAVGLVIDGSSLPNGSTIQLDNIDFAAIVGDLHLFGGEGRNFVVGDGGSQTIYMGPGDDLLFGGAGNDFIGSAGGDDMLDGGADNDLVAGGIGNDKLLGGSGNDALVGGRSATGNWDFYVSASGMVSARHSGAVFTTNGTETVQAAELDASVPELGFLGANAQHLVGVSLLYEAFGRAPDLAGLAYWSRPGITLQDVANAVLASAEWSSTPFEQMDNTAFVRGMYEHMLGRAPDDAGLAWWVGRLSGSAGAPAASRADVLTAVALSDEHKTKALGEDGFKIGQGSLTSQAAWFNGSGNDRLDGGTGSDLLVGGDGFDTAVFAGQRADFRVLMGSDHQLHVAAGSDVDTLSGIEAAEFSDGTLDLGFLNGAMVDAVGLLYQTVFDRASGADGLQWWLSTGFDKAQLAQAFTQATEFQARYGAMNNAAFVHALYENSGLAASSANGAQAWEAYLANHTRAELVAAWISNESVIAAQHANGGLWLF